METVIQVLSEEERVRVHEASLEILEKTGVRVETAPVEAGILLRR